MMKNDLDRAMKDWLCTSKEELTGEAETCSWDETIDNVWLRMAMCAHLLEFKTWRQDDPKPLQGISFAMSQYIIYLFQTGRDRKYKTDGQTDKTDIKK